MLEEEYHKEWARCVGIRVYDIYEGFECKATLDIIEALNSNHTLEEAKSMIENQGHSGMSFSLVCSMVKSFCKRGEEFSNFVNKR